MCMQIPSSTFNGAVWSTHHIDAHPTLQQQQDTFEILARRGRQTLQEFNTCVVERLKRTEKHPNIESQNNAIAQELNAVKQHLLILMQHNYVRSYQLNHPILMQPMSDKGKKAEGSGAKRPAPEVGNPLTRKPIIAYEADLFAAITSIRYWCGWGGCVGVGPV